MGGASRQHSWERRSSKIILFPEARGGRLLCVLMYVPKKPMSDNNFVYVFWSSLWRGWRLRLMVHAFEAGEYIDSLSIMLGEKQCACDVSVKFYYFLFTQGRRGGGEVVSVLLCCKCCCGRGKKGVAYVVVLIDQYYLWTGS